MRAFIASLVVAFVVISAVADSRATPQRAITGTVLEFQPGARLVIANEQTDSRGLEFASRATTYEGPALKPGLRVTVWYRSVAERRPVADKVRVLGPLLRQ